MILPKQSNAKYSEPHPTIPDPKQVLQGHAVLTGAADVRGVWQVGRNAAFAWMGTVRLEGWDTAVQAYVSCELVVI